MALLRTLLLMFTGTFSILCAQHFSVDLSPTGESQLVIIQSSVSSLQPGDEIGIFDSNGVIETVDSGQSPEYGEVLVGSAVWDGSQTEISAIMSIDLSQFGGPVLNGAVEGNPLIIRVWDSELEIELDASAIYSAGTGTFGDLFIAISELEIEEVPESHFNVELDFTGDSQLVIIQSSVSSLQPGDEIGIFDSNGVIETVDSGQSPEYGEVLVGSAVWDGSQTEISAIMSIDLSQFGGPVLNGAVEGNSLTVKVWDSELEIELDASATYSAGTGTFGDLFIAISELTVGEQVAQGCTDSNACNYDPEAEDDDGSCEYVEDCSGECGGDAVVDECGECNGDGIDEGTCDCVGNVEDCSGECGGDAVVDDCGVCGGDGSSCAVYVELEVTTTVDESELEDMEAFEDNFESLIETELDLPDGSVEVTDVTVSDTREVEVTVDFTITLTEEELEESDFTSEEDLNDAWEDVEDEIDEGLPEFVYGCTDDSADNYNPDATINDGSCEYPSQAPDEFGFEISTMQAFYFVIDATMEGVPLEVGQDYLAVYNGDICAGSIVWDGPYTPIPAMGSDGNEWTEGYLATNQVPSFKVYDASEGEIYDAVPTLSAEFGTEDLGFSNNEFYYLDNLNGVLTLTISYSFDLHYGANLVSFHALPEDISVGNVMESLGDAVIGVIGEGVAASPNPVLGWVGSLSDISRVSGYWIKMNDTSSLSLDNAFPTDPAIVYDIHYGANLISFPIAGQVGIGEAIPDDVESNITGIIGEGVAASPNPVLGWVGSLSEWEGTKGYWVKASDSFSFSFDVSGSSRFDGDNNIDSPYDYSQSMEQSFYFIDELDDAGLGIKEGDWILAYEDNVLVGARQWKGGYFTDIPAMGSDGSSETVGYCVPGSIPEFKWVHSNGEVINLNGNTPEWSSNEIYYVSLSAENSTVPVGFTIEQNYPNPFNPSTTIGYIVNRMMDITVSVYDINGKLINEIFSGNISPGSHSVIWDSVDMNGNNVPSGLYIYKVSGDKLTLSNKMLLIK